MQSTKSPLENELSPASAQFTVVGIGASAGGLEAFRQFLKFLPNNSNMAYVFVQHLSPTHDSHLPEIIKKYTTLSVEVINDNVTIEPNHIYIIPPGKILIANDGVLKLEPLKNKKSKVIDMFFSSLAVVHQSFAVGVVLSGALDDGTLGLKVIKSYGGITFAQEESSAIFESMPKSAIKSGAVDFVLPAEQIISKIININHTFQLDTESTHPVHNEEEEETFKKILTVLRIRKGVDFTNYKETTLKRRIVRRMALTKSEKPDDYLNLIRENKTEQDLLYNDMLISVTNFFRDPTVFEILVNNVFPALIESKSINEPIRIWVAGCATGEEAYSIAICLHEFLGPKLGTRKVQIFATDLSEQAITKARSGLYKDSEMVGLSEQRIAEFFTKTDGSFQVNKSIREMCVFAHHNVLKDPPFSKLDLVTCRNLLIYLEQVLQKKALTTFNYALNEKGYLVLGKTETIGTNTDLYNPAFLNHKIYQIKFGSNKSKIIDSGKNEEKLKEIDNDLQDRSSEKDLIKQADSIILTQYSPAGVLVNKNFDIIQFRGKTMQWLELPAGKPVFNILKMAREGLSFEIRNLLRLAQGKQQKIAKEGIFYKVNDKQAYVNIEVIPFPNASQEYYLILFEESVLSDNSFPMSDDKNSSNPDGNSNAWLLRIEQLEKELSLAREDMRSVTEIQEAANEELQSANEELLSGSEELQSLNEELETSKEELQSTNEEISIINTELLDRNEQLTSSRKYTEEIINTIQDPLLILSQDYKIIRATDGFFKLFTSEKEIEGKLLFDINEHQWNIPAIKECLDKLSAIKGSTNSIEIDHFFKSTGRRILSLYLRQFITHTGDPLILLAIHDITDKRKVEEGLAETKRLLKEHKEFLHFAIESASIGVWNFNFSNKELICDMGCRKLLGITEIEFFDYSSFISLLSPDEKINTKRMIMNLLKTKKNGDLDATFRVTRKSDQVVVWLKAKGKAYFNNDNDVIRMSGTLIDVTNEKTLELKTKELLQKKDEFISIASHELKTPITTLKISFDLLKDMKDDMTAEDLKDLINQSSRSINRTTSLIDNLLNISKLNHGETELHKSVFNLASMINFCTGHVRIEGKYQIILQGDLDLSVNADEDLIQQVIVNLVNNAMKYAPDSPNIYIKIENEGANAFVEIRDEGNGIPDEVIPKLFSRYYRADYQGARYSGLGLGLYICKQVLNRHGGKIGVESKVGKGTAFWFILPL